MNGTYVVQGSHVYADQGTYSVTVDVTDDGGSHASTTSTANIAYAPGCRNAGDARADAHFQMPGSRSDLHVDLNAQCKVAHGNGRRGHPAGSIYIHDAHVDIDAGSVRIDARTDGKKNNEITTVKIVGNTATLVGSDHGDSFVVVVTDGGKGTGAMDTVHVTVWNSGGTVIFDSATLTAKPSPNVKVHQE
jgi:hypothetical protein